MEPPPSMGTEPRDLLLVFVLVRLGQLFDRLVGGPLELVLDLGVLGLLHVRPRVLGFERGVGAGRLVLDGGFDLPGEALLLEVAALERGLALLGGREIPGLLAALALLVGRILARARVPGRVGFLVEVGAYGAP